MIFAVGLRGAHPARREELHPFAVETTRLRRLVAERIAENPHHRLGPHEGGRRIDVDPATVADVTTEEHPALGEHANAVGERAIAGMLFEAFELVNERRADAKHPGIEAVVVADLFADIRDLARAKANLRRVVEIEAALDVVV